MKKNLKLILLLEVFMKKNKQTIKCDVFDCKYCDLDIACCSLSEIKVSNCSNVKEKEATMCASYDVRKD